jgi:hypothetical protein
MAIKSFTLVMAANVSLANSRKKKKNLSLLLKPMAELRVASAGPKGNSRAFMEASVGNNWDDDLEIDGDLVSMQSTLVGRRKGHKSKGTLNGLLNRKIPEMVLSLLTVEEEEPKQEPERIEVKKVVIKEKQTKPAPISVMAAVVKTEKQPIIIPVTEAEPETNLSNKIIKKKTKRRKQHGWSVWLARLGTVSRFLLSIMIIALYYWTVMVFKIL